MPLYEYKCQSCGKVIEVIQSYDAKPPKKCEACGGRLDKLVSRSGFVLKGSGWYQTDYKSGSSAPSKSDEGSSASESSPSEKPADAPAKDAPAKEKPAPEKPARNKPKK
jgi:putative FmdB family regulatory protein